ncbi:hypothetical protein Bca4012_021361 [Brassica carinata]|uniref:F-box associated beta-propeller type 3 domain-containing protein n=1 Tax=Brassica carinata TaxID=52824 RepID=A0A8X7WGS2_BRACI|nr:hypothetical protein Bca52824_000207 [Brassica carinata]
MVTLSSESAKYVLFFPTHQSPDVSTYSSLYSYEVTDLDWKGSRSESVHGLILTSVIKIWNPTLRRFLELPHPPGEHSSSRGWWSYWPVNTKYSAYYLKKYSDQPLVLTLGAQESWRTVTKGRFPMHRPTGEYGRCFDGILYYRGRLLGGGHDDVIMSFDVKSENFSPINFAEDRSRQLHMIPYEGKVALVTLTSNVVKLYVLKDAHGHEWTRFDLRVPCKSVGKNSIHFRGTSDAGELIFAPYSFYGDSYILYLDLRRNSTRRVFFERDMGDFKSRSGLDSKHVFTVEVFPNHIESFFSL